MSTIKGCNIGGRAMKACVDLLNDVSDNQYFTFQVLSYDRSFLYGDTEQEDKTLLM